MSNAEQSYVGWENYASPARPQLSPESVTSLTNSLVNQIAHLSGQEPGQVWEEIFNQLDAFYGIKIHDYPSEEGESPLVIAERYDFIDHVYMVALSILLTYQS